MREAVAGAKSPITRPRRLPPASSPHGLRPTRGLRADCVVVRDGIVTAIEWP